MLDLAAKIKVSSLSVICQRNLILVYTIDIKVKLTKVI